MHGKRTTLTPHACSSLGVTRNEKQSVQLHNATSAEGAGLSPAGCQLGTGNLPSHSHRKLQTVSHCALKEKHPITGEATSHKLTLAGTANVDAVMAPVTTQITSNEERDGKLVMSHRARGPWVRASRASSRSEGDPVGGRHCGVEPLDALL
jgi:hypothetical protein